MADPIKTNAPPPPPEPSSEVGNLFNGPSPSLDAPDVPDAPAPAEVVVPEDGPIDDWGKQTVTDVVDAAAPASPALEQPKPEADVKPPPGFVGKQALDQARAETKEALEKIARMNQRFEDTMRMMQGQRPQAEQPKPPTLPDPEQEPVKHMLARFERLEQGYNQMAGLQQQGVGQMQTVQAIQADEMAFKAKHGDYDNALNFVRSKRAQELSEVMGMSPQQVAQTVQNEEMMISMNALRNGGSPAEVAYKLAQRWGYKNGATPVDNTAQTQAQGEKLKAVSQAMQDNRSLGNVAGNAPMTPETMTLESLANLEGDAFVKAFDKLMNGAKQARSQLPGFLQR